MIYEFEELEVTFNGEMFTVYGTFEVDEALGFGEYSDDVAISNIQISSVIDSEGFDFMGMARVLEEEVYQKIMTNREFYEDVQETYFEYMLSNGE